jgi:hypothetical protein
VPADQPTIQAALNVAGTGDVVLVAPGTYSGPGNHNLDFLGKDLTLRSEAGAQSTIIDGSGTDRAFYFHSGESGQALVEGFTIQNTYAMEGGAFFIMAASPSILDCVIRANIADQIGGGAYCLESAASFTRCHIYDNQAGFVGGLYFEDSTPSLMYCTFQWNSGRQAVGGVAVRRQGKATIQDCIFNLNHASVQGGSGGGMLVDESEVTLARCSFNSNRAAAGGAMAVSGSTMLVADCMFIENEVFDSIGPTANGGAISSGASTMIIQRCEFRGNKVFGCDDDLVRGGAIASGDVSLVISECLFQDNAIQCGSPLPAMGGALFVAGSPEISDCVFFRNHAPMGSAIHVSAFDNSFQPTLARCTFTLNSAIAGGTIHLRGGAALTARHSIIAFNAEGAAIQCEDQSSATLSCCDVFGNAGGDWTGCIAGQQQLAGNLALDPLFCDRQNGVLSLHASSPCAPGNAGYCGLIGALPVDCVVQAVTPSTWGRIKAAYSR